MDDSSRNYGLKNCLAGLVLLGAAAAPALAQNVGELAVFGDNVADPGNIPGLLQAGNDAGLPAVDTNFPPSPPYFGNRYSNGLVAAELLPDLPGILAATVDNRAVGNAFSAQLPVSLAGGALIGNGSSIPGPIGRELLALNNTDVNSQVSQYIAARGEISSRDLMLIYMSANDAALALNTIALTGLSGIDAQNLILNGATADARNTVAAAGQLIAAGARQVVLANLPDIGQTPAAAAGGLAGVTAASGFSQVANQALATGASTLAAETGAVVTVFDSFTLLGDIVANPQKYGLTNVSDPCLAVPGCAADPGQAAGFLFWDAFFPTAGVQAIAAAALADTINAPKTLAAQAEVGRYAAEKFALSLLARQTNATGSGELNPGWRISLNYARLDWQRDGETMAFGYDAQLDSVTLAAEYTGSELSAGLALSQDRGDVVQRGLPAGFDIDSTRLGFWLARHSGPWSTALAISFGDDEMDNIQRQTSVAGQVASADGRGDSLSAVFEVQRHLSMASLMVSPALRLGYSESDLEPYLERGAVALNQRVERRRSTAAFAELGVAVSGANAAGGSGFQWYPTGSLFYRAELGDDQQAVVSRLASVQEVARSFSIGAPDERYWRLALALEAHSGSGMRFRVGGTLEDGADRLDGFSLGASLSYQW